MNKLYYVFGDSDQLTFWQMSVRAFAMFFITLIMIRIGGMRIFGRKSSFDTIVAIMLGGILARGVVGASSFLSTISACATMTIIHRLVAWIVVKNDWIADLIKGKPVILYKDGTILWKNMERATMSRGDLMESLRLETKNESLEAIDRALMETNGRISFILKEKK